MVSEKFYGVTAEKILDHSTGNVAEDFYPRFKHYKKISI